MSVSAKAGPWLELIPLDAVTFAAMHMSAFGGGLNRSLQHRL